MNKNERPIRPIQNNLAVLFFPNPIPPEFCCNTFDWLPVKKPRSESVVDMDMNDDPYDKNRYTDNRKINPGQDNRRQDKASKGNTR